jgi:hypothetical protein
MSVSFQCNVPRQQNCFGKMATNNVRCTQYIKSTLFFTANWKFKENPVKRYIWSIVFMVLKIGHFKGSSEVL